MLRLCSPLIIFLLISTAQAGTAPTLPLPAAGLAAGQARFGLATSYLKTTSNFDRNGTRAPLASSASLTSSQAHLFLQYGVSQQLTLLGNLPIVSNSVTGVSTVNNSTVSITSSGLGDGTFGARYQMFRHPVRFMADAQVQYPLYSRLQEDSWAGLTGASNVPLGTGITEFTVLARGEFPLSTEVYVGLALGHMARTGGFSNLLPYEAYFQYEEGRGRFGKIGLSGALSIADDQNVGSPPPAVPKERATVVTAGSQLYNAINPSYLKVNAVLGTYIGSTVFLNASAELPITGKNIPAQPVFALLLGFDLGGKRVESGYVHSNRGFQEYYLTSRVTRVNNRLRQILIDRGEGDQIRVGELLDVFEPDMKDGSFGETVGRGRVLEVGPTKAKIQVLEYFKEINLQEGFVVRRPVR